jgi:hypothetical protein
VITIVASTAIVQASGIAALVHQLQGGGPDASNTIVTTSVVDQETHIVTAGGVSVDNTVLGFGGAEQDTHILNPSASELVGTINFVVFFPDLARGATLFGVVGTAETVEKFFDTSPFFFSPHETDPNTLRDLSEAQQFLIFSQTSIFSYDNFRNTISPTQIISVKGDLLPKDVINPENLVTNGSFEQSLSAWTSFKGTVSDKVEVRTDQPTGAGFNDGSPVSPTDGSFWVYLSAVGSTNQVYIKHTVDVSNASGRLVSEDLLNFSFDAVFNTVANTNRQFQTNVIFYEDDQVRRNLIYRVSGMGTPTIPTLANVTPATNINLTAASGIVNSFNRNLQTDLSSETFPFDRIDLWFIVDTAVVSAATNVLIDNVRLTIHTVPENLERTNEFAHIVTTHPTAPGFPFTISGSDNITQVDLSGPFFTEQEPAPNSTFNLTATPVNFNVRDTSSALDTGTIDIFIDDVQVVDGSVVTGNSPWSVGTRTVLAPGDIRYEFTRDAPFEQQSIVVVSGSFADFAAVSNFSSESYQFTILGSGSLDASLTGLPDADPPTITPLDPEDLDTNISPNTAIVWSTADNAAGVDSSKTRLSLNGATVLVNDLAINGSLIRTTNSSLGFDYTYVPDSPFSFGQTITGTIEAADFSLTGPNTGTLTYEFTITSSDTLEIVNFFLDPNESVLLTSGTIASVDVIDLTYGVLGGKTTLTLNGETPVGLQTTTSGAGPLLVHFEFPLQPLVDFRSDLTILVHAENAFPGSFPVIK